MEEQSKQCKINQNILRTNKIFTEQSKHWKNNCKKNDLKHCNKSLNIVRRIKLSEEKVKAL